ncbi:hypothetical protein GCM10023259_056700 [Thermocatellispora tengchongensis]
MTTTGRSAHAPGRTVRRTWAAVPAAAQNVGAHPHGARQPAPHRLPARARLPQPRLQDHRGPPGAGAVQVQQVPAHVHQPSRGWEAGRVAPPGQ